MNTAEKIKFLRNKKGISQEELGKKVGLKRAAINKYETGRVVNIKKSTLEKLAQALDVTPMYLLDDADTSLPTENKSHKTLEPVTFGSVARIPVYGRVPAGIPLEAIEDIDGYIDIPAQWKNDEQQYFGLKVVGDSMYPKYMDGDTIVVKKQSACESGQDAVVYVNDECDATLKKVVKNIDHVILQPLNPEYEPKMYEFTGEGCPLQIAGIVVEIRRKV